MRPFDVMFLSSLVLAIYSTPARAGSGNGAGNGGDALVCVDLTKCPGDIRMLDSFESKLPLVMPREADTLRKKVYVLLNRLDFQSVDLRKMLSQEVELFLKDAEKFHETGNPNQLNTLFGIGTLPNVPDEGATFIPPGYRIEQLIIRTAKPLPHQKRYMVRSDLWTDPRMSDDEHAAAILHEAIYGYLLDYATNVPSDAHDQTNPSGCARWFNGLLLSDQLRNYEVHSFYTDTLSYHIPLKLSRIDSGMHFDHGQEKNRAFRNGNGTITDAAFVDSIPLIAGLENRVTSVREISFVNGVWQSMKIAKFGRFDAKRMQKIELPFLWMDFTDKSLAEDLIGREIISLDESTVHRTETGFTVTGAHRQSWEKKLRIFGGGYYSWEQGSYRQYYELVNLELDSHGRILSIRRADREKRKYEREYFAHKEAGPYKYDL